jgi:hypothetical protein
VSPSGLGPRQRISLDCPACTGKWKLRCTVETWRDPEGQEVQVVAGDCDRCGSLQLMVPSQDGLDAIASRTREGRLRRELYSQPAEA